MKYLQYFLHMKVVEKIADNLLKYYKKHFLLGFYKKFFG